MLEAQTLWDATMAHSLATAAVSPEAAVNGAASILLDSHGDKGTKRPLIVHVCGKFHCEHHLGIPEHLKRYSPNLNVLVAVCAGEAELSRMQESQVSMMGHFVSVSAPVPPSFQVTHPV